MLIEMFIGFFIVVEIAHAILLPKYNPHFKPIHFKN